MPRAKMSAFSLYFLPSKTCKADNPDVVYAIERLIFLLGLGTQYQQ